MALDAAEPHGRPEATRPLRTRAALVKAATLVLSAGLVGAACGSAAPRPASSPIPATGCGRASSATPDPVTVTVTVDGRSRTAVVHLPLGYRSSSATPLVLNLHGSGSTPAGQEALSGMDAAADRDGYIVAYPQAAIPAGTGFVWNVPGVPLLGGQNPPADAADDVSFLVYLVAELRARYCVDGHRVFATGLSGGGRMASQLACDASGVFAAVAPVAGLRAPEPCPATRAVPVVAFHGTADPVDPYAGHGQAYWTYSVPDAGAAWGRRDRCPPPVTTSGAGYTLTAYRGCAGGAAVELYALAGAGHQWPGGPPLPAELTKVSGPQTDAVNADATMWTFFRDHPLP